MDRPRASGERLAAGRIGSDADPTKPVAKLEVVEHLRKTHAIRGALAEFRVDDTECTVSFKGPGYSADTFIDRDSGEYTMTELDHGLIALINDLHKGRDTGAVWSWVIDLSAGLMTIISLTGLVLLFYLKLQAHPRPGGRARRHGGPDHHLPALGSMSATPRNRSYSENAGGPSHSATGSVESDWVEERCGSPVFIPCSLRGRGNADHSFPPLVKGGGQGGWAEHLRRPEVSRPATTAPSVSTACEGDGTSGR